MRLHKYFDRAEFKCSCCGFNTVDAELLRILVLVREHFNSPVIINSACRCVRHNAKVGGKRKSRHLTGKAADIRVKNVSPRKVAAYLKAKFPNTYGIGAYNSFTHIDSRSNKARW